MCIWEACNGIAHIQPLRGLLYRLVESQEQIATLNYVDTLEEQAMLEEMLEAVKPSLSHVDTHYHYLLRTPFRYPPLKWGSRFGDRSEASIFYGAHAVTTALAESAYYRHLFIKSMETPRLGALITTQHTLFSARYKTEHGVRLTVSPFDQYVIDLKHPSNYEACQALGTAMRKAEVDVFEYLSARDTEGVCVGVFSIHALVGKAPLSTSSYLCQTSLDSVSFKSMSDGELVHFDTKDFVS